MSAKLSESGKKLLNDQAVIRAMSPAHTAKWLARLMRIPVRTARFWTEQTVPVYRRADLYLLMIEKFHEKRRWEDEELLPALYRGAGLTNEVETLPASSVARAVVHLVASTADGIEAVIKRIEE